MKSIFAIAFGILLTVQAQVMLPHRRAINAPISAWTPQSITTIRYYWVSEDLATNANVGAWTDRIQGNVAGQGDTSLRPTNYALGMYFNGSSFYLTNNPIFKMTNAVYTNSQSVFLILIPNSAPTTFGFMLGSSNSVTGDGFGNRDIAKWFVSGDAGSSTFDAYADGVACDVSFTATNQLNIYYTNGVVASGPTSNQGVWRDQQFIGVLNTMSGYYKGYIREIIIFSNTLDSAQITMLHKYATNKYGYSP